VRPTDELVGSGGAALCLHDLPAQIGLALLGIRHGLAQLLHVLDGLAQHAGAELSGVSVSQHLLHTTLHVDTAVKGQRDLAGLDPARDGLLGHAQDSGELCGQHAHTQELRHVAQEGQ
jgi:hypothetical protein